MGLFSFLRKSKKESTSTEGEFHSRAEEESNAVRSRKKRSQGSTDKQANEAVDPVLPEKKRARRRLVGAIALVLAVIIFLPMILDSVPKPASGDIEIQIPSKDKALQASRQQAAPDLVAAANVESKEKAAETAPVAAAALDAEKPAAVPDTVPVVAAAKKEEPKAAEPAKTAKPQIDGKVQAKSPAHADPASEGKSDSKPEPKPVSNTTTTLAKQSTAKAPAQEGNAAETARATALLEGKTPDKPDAKSADAKSGAEKKATHFVLQVAALASKEKVSELQNKLIGAGIKSYTQKVATQSGERIRVRIGPLASKEEVERVRAKLTKLGLNGTVVPA